MLKEINPDDYFFYPASQKEKSVVLFPTEKSKNGV